MANYLKFRYQARTTSDSELVSFTSVDNAKSILDFSSWDFTGVTPEWTLEDTNTTLAVKIPFTDEQAHSEMKTFHENVKDTWHNVTTTTDYRYNYKYPDNEYVVADTDIHSE